MKCPVTVAAVEGVVGVCGRVGMCTNEHKGKYGMCQETIGWRRSLLAEAQARLSEEGGI